MINKYVLEKYYNAFYNYNNIDNVIIELYTLFGSDVEEAKLWYDEFRGDLKQLKQWKKLFPNRKTMQRYRRLFKNPNDAYEWFRLFGDNFSKIMKLKKEYRTAREAYEDIYRKK